MIAYVDSSVLLRILLDQPGQLEAWPRIETGVTSALAQVECLRTLDRLRLEGALEDDELAECRATVYRLTAEMSVVEVTAPILDRAGQAFPTVLGTLDAIHLSTALAWREQTESLELATHDRPLGVAARAMGFEVIGL